jgi:hypothetical protein
MTADFDMPGSFADFEDPERFAPVEPLSEEATWCRRMFDSIKVGGVWGVPRSGLLFTRVDEDTLVMTARMPYDPEMPVTAAQLDAQQMGDYEQIKLHMNEAGVTVRDETIVAFFHEVK